MENKAQALPQAASRSLGSSLQQAAAEDCAVVQGTVALPRRGRSLQLTHQSPVQFFDRCQESVPF